MKIIRKLKYPLTIILFLLIIGFSVYTKITLNQKKYDNVLSEEIVLEDIENEEPNEETTKYNIDIKGAIKNPGVYLVDSTLTVNDVIKVAGGLTENADTSLINLAKKISDEMVIIVYTKEEVKNSNIVDTVIKVVEKECVCPNIENDSCLNNEIEDTITNNPNSKLININTATIEELQTINGIGEAKAKSIVKHREENGNFKTIEELKNVDGIGDNLYESIKIYITT